MNTWSFHHNCGSSIVLLDDNKTAKVNEDNPDRNYRVVISSKSMLPGKLYEIEVKKKLMINGDVDTQKCTAFGLCTRSDDPSTLNPLTTCEGIDTFVGVNDMGCYVTSPRPANFQGDVFLDVKTINGSDYLGVMVDESGSVHLYLDNHKKENVATINMKEQPCFAVFDLNTSLEVSTCRVRLPSEPR